MYILNKPLRAGTTAKKKINIIAWEISFLHHILQKLQYQAKAPAAEHGYDPAMDDMHASFYARGPAFLEHKKIAGLRTSTSTH
jgi:hypothetical protein